MFKGENTVNGLYIYELPECNALNYVYSWGQNKFPVIWNLIAWGLSEATRSYSWLQCIGQFKCDGTCAETNFVFRRNGRVHLNRRGLQFSRLLVAEVCASAVVMLDTPCCEVVWRVLATHPHSPVSPSLPLLCVTVCHHISTWVSLLLLSSRKWWKIICIFWKRKDGLVRHFGDFLPQ